MNPWRQTTNRNYLRRTDMAVKIAINGYGRIGRMIMRAIYESDRRDEFQVVAINDLASLEANAHLTQYDTAHGRFPADVSIDNGDLIINGDRIKVFAERNPADLPWAELGVEVVHECTGLFRSKETAGAHLTAGASKVIISAPGQQVDNTIVYGVNHDTLKSTDQVISNASCTTNCLAPLAKVLNDSVGIKSGLMTTIHAYTNDQVLTDVFHSDLRRARSATMSQIPTKTGAAAAVGLVLPDLNGKLDGFSMRVPTINVSVVDLVFVAGRDTSVEEINSLVKSASEGYLAGVLGYNELPLVSVDFNHNPDSSIFDAGLTKVMEGNLVKVLSWYDNEWGFSNRMLDTTLALLKA
jgi:glyceraldehyde 3-phosphate dehydrogenase